MTFNEAYEVNSRIAKEHPNVNRLEDPTADYNCHFYGWYSQDIDVSSEYLYWIPKADPFLSDLHREYIGSYEDVENGLDIEVGYIATYWLGVDDEQRVCVHSAYVSEIDSQGNIVCTSKWGKAGLYEHSWNDVPWEYKNSLNGDVVDVEYYSYVQGEHDPTYSSVDSNEHLADCQDCDHAEYESHNNSFVSDSDSLHKSTCTDCGYTEYAAHSKQYINANSNQHRIRCYTCGYSVYEDHDLYLYADYGEDGFDVKCRDCSYTNGCWEEYEYLATEEGHYIGCPCGSVSFFDEHTPGTYSRRESNP